MEGDKREQIRSNVNSSSQTFLLSRNGMMLIFDKAKEGIL